MDQDAPEAAAGVREGDILAGKYRIGKVLGAGGMGVVMAARHVYLDEQVAIKFLNSEFLTNKDVVARFTQEARAAVKIKSEHVGRVLDVGVLDSGAPYIVMEYLEGLDLAEYLRNNGPLSVNEAVEFVLQACEALAEAHSLGIVHRDLKPANLFCAKRPGGLTTVKVLDFGISKSFGWVTSAPQLGITKTNTIMGSPLYMSPEQIQSAKDVDARSDIWSLGVVLYEVLVGNVPFDGDTVAEVCARVIAQTPAPLSELRTDIAPELDAAVAKCLSKERTSRHATVAELAKDLAPFGPTRARASLDRIARVIHAAGLSDAPEPASSTRGHSAGSVSAGTIAPLSNTRRGSPRGRVVAASVMAIALGLCAVVGIMQLGRANETRNRASTPSGGSAIVAEAPVTAATSGTPTEARTQSSGTDSVVVPQVLEASNREPGDAGKSLEVDSIERNARASARQGSPSLAPQPVIAGQDNARRAKPVAGPSRPADRGGVTVRSSVASTNSPNSSPHVRIAEDPLGGQY